MNSRMVSRYLMGCILALLASLSWGVVVELEDPSAIAIPAGKTETTTMTAIKFGLSQQNWQVLSEVPGEIIAELVVRGRHQIAVSVLYDERYIRIRYHDSRNMYYQGGVPESDDVDEWSVSAYKKVPLIHHRYNGWVKTLASSIQRAISTQL